MLGFSLLLLLFLLCFGSGLFGLLWFSLSSVFGGFCLVLFLSFLLLCLGLVAGLLCSVLAFLNKVCRFQKK